MALAHLPAGRGRPPIAPHRHDGLLALLHRSTNTEQGSADAGRVTAGHGLLAFLRSPTPTLVAVAQGGNPAGDICDKETKHVAEPTGEGTRLRTDSRLMHTPITDTQGTTPPVAHDDEGHIEEDVLDSPITEDLHPDFDSGTSTLSLQNLSQKAPKPSS